MYVYEAISVNECDCDDLNKRRREKKTKENKQNKTKKGVRKVSNKGEEGQNRTPCYTGKAENWTNNFIHLQKP